MNEDPQILKMALLSMQPSQLYINQEKLSEVQAQVDFSDIKNIPPVPIKVLGSILLMTDGHTRAYTAYLEGLRTIPVIWEEDELDWEAYQICIDWCRDEGIRSIADLGSRVVNAQDYQEKWLDRCDRMQVELVQKQATKVK